MAHGRDFCNMPGGRCELGEDLETFLRPPKISRKGKVNDMPGKDEVHFFSDRIPRMSSKK
jgi:hypothetical protein